MDPGAARGCNDTDIPGANVCEQSAPQSIPAGWLVTLPEPAPLIETVRRWDVCTNVAVTERGPSRRTSQGPVPVQSPLQPENTLPVPGVAVRETVVPEA
jgi:hypothetical protein